MSRESNDAFDALAAREGYKPGTWTYIRAQKAWHAAIAFASSPIAPKAPTEPKIAAASSGVSDAQITAAARVLCKRNADVCGVNADDSWKIYADDFKEDARCALAAALASAAPEAVVPRIDADKFQRLDPFEEAMRQTWRMVDVFRPSGQPGSYARGEHNGICAALKTVRENYERLIGHRDARHAAAELVSLCATSKDGDQSGSPAADPQRNEGGA